MPEIGDLIKIGVATIALGLVALVVAGFYFTITGASGQGFLVGQFELFAEAVFSFISAPFVALAKMIEGIPKLLGMRILSYSFLIAPAAIGSAV